MKRSKLSIAGALAGALFATSASATTYSVVIQENGGIEEITGDLTVVGGTVTAFTGTATGFDGVGPTQFDGPTTLGAAAGGPTFPSDQKWGTSSPYVSSGNSLTGGGLELNNGSFNFLIYDYTDATNNYGIYLAWYGSSGGDKATITESLTTPLPAALPLFAGGLGMIALIGRRKKRKQVTAASVATV